MTFFSVYLYITIPGPIPQIIIEDPEGEQQCDQCVWNSEQIQELTDGIQKVILKLNSTTQYCIYGRVHIFSL